MKKEEAIANAMSVFTFAELKQIGYIRTITDYELEIQLTIHFKCNGNDAHESKKDIYPLLMDGTTIEEVSFPNRGYDCLDIIWSIKDQTQS